VGVEELAVTDTPGRLLFGYRNAQEMPIEPGIVFVRREPFRGSGVRIWGQRFTMDTDECQM